MRAENSLQQIRDWFNTPLGEHVLGTERAVLDQLLPNLFGYHLLQMSIQQAPLYDSSPINHKFSMGLGLSDSSPFIGNATALPFESDSIDVIVLHHLLDFYDSPQQMLREVSRVSIPMGHVIIIGFNPLSLWGLAKPIGRMRGQAPWTGTFFRPGRLMDWLNLLNFKIDRVHYSHYGLPLNEPRILGNVPDFSQGLSRRSNMPFGGVFAIVARKHVGTMTPIRPVWKSRSFGQLTVVRPANRGVARTPPEATE
jgi:SAM-dependent methyltransferase